MIRITFFIFLQYFVTLYQVIVDTIILHSSCVCVYIYMSVCVFHILCTVYYMVGALGHFRVPFRGGLTGGV